MRPWGEYFVSEYAEKHKVKQIKVKPKGRLFYQYHHKCSKVWTMENGTGKITLDVENQHYKVSEVIQIPQYMKHRIKNPSQNKDCVFIEVQLGRYFGEDDIVRLEDDFDRK
jgi:mannose-6-phosphate isomerase